MATNKKRTGYSDALGGYGVPSQVAITGEATEPGKTAKTAKSGKSRGLVFRPKPKNIIVLAVIAAAVVVALLFITGVIGTGQYASSISPVIEKDIQSMNGVDVTIYRPVIAEDVDWNNIDKGKRAGIAKYAANKALEQAEAEQAGIFSIMGMTYDRQPAFMYSPNANNTNIQVFANGAVEDLISIE
jgi:hypothetical protein